MTTIAYARVSTTDQTAGLAAQERDLRAAGADRVISEQVSSLANRPGLKEALAAVQHGDVLMVTKPDRLARNTAHLLTIVEDLHARGVGLIILSMGGGLLDTRSPTGKLLLTMLGAVAAFERDIMLERQKEGIAKARAEGKYKGAKPRIDHDALIRTCEDLGVEAGAREFGVGRSWAYEVMQRHRGAQNAVSSPPGISVMTENTACG